MADLPGDLKEYFLVVGEQIDREGLTVVTTNASEQVLFVELVRRRLLTYKGTTPSLDVAEIYNSVNFTYAGKSLYAELT